MRVNYCAECRLLISDDKAIIRETDIEIIRTCPNCEGEVIDYDTACEGRKGIELDNWFNNLNMI